MGRPAILSFALTDTGVHRLNNQDTYLVDDDLGVYLVADGMGGHAGGEVASSMAVESVRLHLAAQTDVLDADTVPEHHPLAGSLTDAVKRACAAIHDRGSNDRELHGMGTTLTGVAFSAGHAFLAHVGDSRCYQIRDGNIVQLSEDHTIVEDMVRNGLLAPEQAEKSPMRHVLSRSVGVERDVSVDLVAVEARPGDIFVLCSDGLAGVVAASEIRDLILANFLRDGPRKLVDLANARGGPDNITVVVVAVHGDD
jgi:protein phosphatase